MTATLEPGLRGPEAEALLAEHGLTLGHYPAVVRARHDRRLRRHPLERPVQCRLRPLRRAGRRPHGVATPRGALDLGTSPANAAGPDLRQLLLGSEGAFGVITVGHRARTPQPRDHGVRGLALAVLRRGRGRDAHPGPGRAAAHRDPALRRVGDRDQPRPTRRRSAAPSDRGCLMITGYEGDRRAGGDEARCGDRRARRASEAPRWATEPGEAWVARPLPRALPARRAARRRRAGRDPGDRHVLVQPRTALRRREVRARRRRSATARSCCATSPTSTRPAARSTSPSPPSRPTTRSPSGRPPRPLPATR